MPAVTITDYVLTGVGKIGVYVQLRDNVNPAVTFTSATPTDGNGQFSITTPPPPADYSAYTSPVLGGGAAWTLYDPHFRIAYTRGDTIISAIQTPTEAVLVSGVDASAGEQIQVTLTANRVMGLPLNGVAGQKLHLIVTQGGAGGFALTFAAGITVTNFGLNMGVGSVTDAWLTCITPTTWVIWSPSVAGQDIAPRSVSVSSGPYTATALPGWIDTLGVGQWGNGIWNVKSGKNPSGSAKGDGQRVTDGAMGSGSAVLTSATGLFASGDVGKLVTVAGGGAAGVVLATTIASFQSATQVTLTAANASGGAINAKAVSWATDDKASIQAAITAAEPTGGIIAIPQGDYGLSAQLVLKGTRTLIFQGAGAQTSRSPTRLFSAGGASFIDRGDGVSGANDFGAKLTILDLMFDGVDQNMDIIRNRDVTSLPGRDHYERVVMWGFGTGTGYRDTIGGITTQDSMWIDVLVEFGGTGVLLQNGAWTFVNCTFAFLSRGVDIRANNKSVFTGVVFSGCVDDVVFGDAGQTYTNPYLFLGCWHENSTDACVTGSAGIVNVDATFDTCRLHTSGTYQIYMGGMTTSSMVLRQSDFGGVATKIHTGNLGTGNVVYSENARVLNRVGIVAGPINSTRGSIGPHLLAGDTFTAIAVASTDYFVTGCKGAMIFVTAGTGVAVTIKDRLDGAGSAPGAGTTPLAVYVPAGMYINFGAFSVAPTLVVMID
jgi:hypothetical protein